MGTQIEQLANFACGLLLDGLPEPVIGRVRLQHVHTAATVRAALEQSASEALRSSKKRRGAAVLMSKGTAPARDAVALHAAGSAWFGPGAHVLGGSTSHGAVPTTWAHAKGRTVGDLLVATTAANEVAARIGTAMMIGPDMGLSRGVVHAVSAATSTGLLLGLDEKALAHALAIAVSAAGSIPPAVIAGCSSARGAAVQAAVLVGMDAATQAKSGVHGCLDVLEAPGGLLERASWIPLHRAFSGYGTAWLTQTMSYPVWPGPLSWASAYDAVSEILARHVKAADKRLRTDQIERIVIRVPAPAYVLDHWMRRRTVRHAGSLPWSVRHGTGALILAHQLGPDELEADWWDEHRDVVGEVAGKVELVHDWGQNMKLAEHAVETLAPLLAGVTAGEWKHLVDRLADAPDAWPRPAGADMLTVMKARPDRWLDRCRYATGDLEHARLNEWQLQLGCSVDIHTSRGGCWPETRTIPRGSPGWSWGETVEEVSARFVGGVDKRAASIQGVLEAAGTDDAEAWVGALLNRS